MLRRSFALAVLVLPLAALACGDGGLVATDPDESADPETQQLIDGVEALEARVAALEAVLREASGAPAQDAEFDELMDELALLRLRVRSLEAAADPVSQLAALDPLSCARQYVEQQHIFMADYLTGAIPGCQP